MILSYAIIIRAIMSWFPNLPDNALTRALYDVTEPLLSPFRRFQIGGGGFGIDFSPIFAYFTILLVRTMVLPMFFNLLSKIT